MNVDKCKSRSRGLSKGKLHNYARLDVWYLTYRHSQRCAHYDILPSAIFSFCPDGRDCSSCICRSTCFDMPVWFVVACDDPKTQHCDAQKRKAALWECVQIKTFLHKFSPSTFLLLISIHWNYMILFCPVCFDIYIWNFIVLKTDHLFRTQRYEFTISILDQFKSLWLVIEVPLERSKI